MGGLDVAAYVRCDGGLGVLPSMQPAVSGRERQELSMRPLFLLLLHSVLQSETCGTAVHGARGSVEGIAVAAGWEGRWGGAEEEGDGFGKSDEESRNGAEELSVVSQVQDGD